MNPTTIQILGTILFALALVHTFSTRHFERMAHARPAHAGLWHLLGEVEVVFGFWALVLVIGIFLIAGKAEATGYLDQQNFTEPLFVFAVMVVAGSRPILHATRELVGFLARVLPLERAAAMYFLTLGLVPLLGSFITEPAAMTLAAILLRDQFFRSDVPLRFKYATLGVLFVNISIGGTLTPYAAPPVLMVAGTWGWDLPFMLTTFGWKAALAVVVNTVGVTLLFRPVLRGMPVTTAAARLPMPFTVVLVHLLFLTGIVVFAHHPPVFLGLFLFFLGFAQAYERYQERLILREGLLVAFFLAGLVVLGGQQRWWLDVVLRELNPTTLFFGAAALTAITDNAALTYLGSLVEGVSPAFQYALVSGAVAGGGLTVIANAPNPAGFSILRDSFPEGTIRPGGLLVAALAPTAVAAAAFLLL